MKGFSNDEFRIYYAETEMGNNIICIYKKTWSMVARVSFSIRTTEISVESVLVENMPTIMEILLRMMNMIL